MKLLLFITCLSLSTFTFADDVILFTEDNTQQTELNNLLNSEENQREIDVTQNLASIRVSEFSVESGVEELSAMEIFHDVSKFPESNNWYYYYFQTEVGIPFAFTFPNLLGPVGFNFGFKPGWKGEFAVVSPKSELKKDDPEILNNINKLKLGAIQGLKSLKIPSSAQGLLEAYPQGSEIIFDGRGYLSAYTGLNFGVPGVSANANVIAVVEGQLKKTIKILENSERQYVQLRYEKSKKKGKGGSFDLGIGVSLFDTTFPIGSTNVNFTGALRVNFITKSYLKSTKEKLLYDFTYDLSNPDGKKAFEEALKGNLIPSQTQAITRLEADKYLGVILNEQRSDLIFESIKDSKYGFRINESSLDNSLSNLTARESLSGFFEIGRTRQSTKTESKQTLFYREQATSKEFKHEAKDSTRFLFGLINNNKNLKILSKIIDAEVMSEGQGIGNIKTYKMTFSYENNHKNGAKTDVYNFLYKASRSLGHNNSVNKNFIADIRSKKLCTGDAKIKVNATIYKEAFDKMLKYTEAEIWAMFGKYLGYSLPVKYRYKEKREDLYKELRSIYKKYKDRRGKKYSDQKRYHKWAYRLFKKFRSVNFPEKFIALNSQKNTEEKLEQMHKLISSFEMTDDLLHFLLIMAQGDLKNQDDAKGVISKFNITSSGCEFNWFLDHKPNFRAEDLFADWD